MGASSMMYGRPMEAGMSPMSDGTRRRELELHPLVSIIIPCRNESAHIATCLDSILANDYPSERIEIIVVDGMSDDGTRDVLATYAERYEQIRVMDNPRRITPTALNIGICAARGDVIMRMDAHCRYPQHYVSGLVAWQEQSGADNVGGACRTLPANDGRFARAIAASLSHPFAVGNAYFRIGVDEPRWVDTVPFGCYRRSVFDRIGMFDEELARNQDDELNHRLLAHGGRILIVPDVTSEYFARDSMRKLWRMYYQYGYFKPLVMRKLNAVFTARQLVPPLFVATLVTLLVLAPLSAWLAAALGALLVTYTAAAVACAFHAAPSGDPLLAFPLAATFPVVHVSYGVGFLRGIVDFMLRRKRGDHRAEAVAVTR